MGSTGCGRAPASVVLVYPLVHPELPAWDPAELAMIRNNPGAVFFAPEWLADINLNYVGDPAALADPYAFAANGDVTGLPPTLILNCELDTLRSSGEAYAEQLKAAGVEVTVRCEPGAVHGCLNEPTTPQGARSLDRIADWLTDDR